MSGIIVEHGVPAGRILGNPLTHGAISDYAYVVPAGKRWLVFGGYVERDTSATLAIELMDATPTKIVDLHYVGAGTDNESWGVIGKDETRLFQAFPLEEGWRIQITWGAAQTTPETTLLVLELDV